MAGERKGKLYEALTKVALDESLDRRSKIFWNETPAGISVEPDITVGRDKDAPAAVILVTHSGSSKKSGMKFWRNLGELAELKTRLETLPDVYTIAFDAVIYENLQKIQEASFDGQLVVGQRPYFSDLLAWILCSTSKFPKGKSDQLQYVLLKLTPASRTLFFDGFKNDVKSLLKTRDMAGRTLWADVRKRRPPATRIARTTHFRRGLSKLLLFTDLEKAVDFFAGTSKSAPDIPDVAYTLGMVTPSIAGPQPKDSEIRSACTHLDRQVIFTVLKTAPLDDMADWLTQLREAGLLRTYGDYVNNNISVVTNANLLYRAIDQLHANPKALLRSIPGRTPSKSVWLLEYLIELIKLSTGASNGYGHAQLAREVVESKFGSEDDLKSAGQFGGGVGLPVWIRRQPTQFREDLVEGICFVLAKRLAAIGLASLKRLIESAPALIARNILETKVLTYYKFDPIFSLLSTKIPTISEVSIRSCFAERSLAGASAGVCQVAMIESTLINWQSATDSGRDHKKKELCGRGIGLRYTWNQRSEKFTRRRSVKKLILVLDGTWRQDDLDDLIAAGWDEIYYPDELDALLRAIE